MNYRREYNERDAGLFFSIFIAVVIAAQFGLNFIAKSVHDKSYSFYTGDYFGWILQASLYVILLLAVVLYHVFAKVNVVKANGLKDKFGFVDFIMAIVLGVGMLLTFYIFNYLYSLLLEAIGYSAGSGSGMRRPIDSAPTFFIAVVIMCVFPAVVEEIVFRGAVFKGYSKVFNFIPVMLLSAACFMIFHMYPPQFLNTFLIGIFLAILVKKTKNIKAAIVIHFTNNFVFAFLTLISNFMPEDYLGAANLLASQPTTLQMISLYLIFFFIGGILFVLGMLYFFLKKPKRPYDAQFMMNQYGMQPNQYGQPGMQPNQYGQSNMPQNDYGYGIEQETLDIVTEHRDELPYQDAMYHGKVLNVSTIDRLASLLFAIPGFLLAIGYTIYVLI